MAFGLQKLRFAYKYLVVKLQSCISIYKTASRFAIELHLGLQLSFFILLSEKQHEIIEKQ